MSGRAEQGFDLRPLVAVLVVVLVAILQGLPWYAARGSVVQRFLSVGMSDEAAYGWYSAALDWGGGVLLLAILVGALGGPWACLVVGLALQSLGVGLFGVFEGETALGMSWMLATAGHVATMVGIYSVLVDRVRNSGALLAAGALVSGVIPILGWSVSLLTPSIGPGSAVLFMVAGPVLALAAPLAIAGGLTCHVLDRRRPRALAARTFEARPLLVGLAGGVLASVVMLLTWVHASTAWAIGSEFVSAHVTLRPLLHIGGTALGVLVVVPLGLVFWRLGSRVGPLLTGAAGLALVGLARWPGVPLEVPGLYYALELLDGFGTPALVAGVLLLWGQRLHWRLVVPVAVVAESYIVAYPVVDQVLPQAPTGAFIAWIVVSILMFFGVVAWVAAAFLWPRLLGPTSGSADPRPSSPAPPSSSP